jgi:hypothetical protein
MGRVLKAVVLVLGLVSYSFGSWVVGTACFVYVLLSSRSVNARGSSVGSARNLVVGNRAAASIILASLALVALASGGTYSPVVFTSLAILVYLGPRLSIAPGLSGVVPVKESILLRSRLFLLAWHTIAEVKPGSEDIPRALSSFAGNLMVTNEGRAFTYSTVFALDSKAAQKAVDFRLKAAIRTISEGGAYLLPIDSKTACELLSRKLVPLKQDPATFPGPGANIIALVAEGNYVKRMCAYKVADSPKSYPVLPRPTKALERDLLLWDVLQSFGKVHSWQEPDSYSNLLQSIHATASEPISQRFSAIETSAESITVRTLGGDHVSLTRSQLRAILSMNS